MAKQTTHQALLKAAAHARKGEVDAARQLFDTVLERFPKNKRARSGLATLEGGQPSKRNGATLLADMQRMVEQLKRGELETVAKNAAALLKMNEENVLLLNIYGVTLARLGRQKHAEYVFQKAVNLEPEFVDAQANLANIYETKNELDAAIACYQRALAVAPGSLALIVRMGEALKERGDQEDALECFERVLSIDPDNIPALRSLGGLLILRRSHAEAVACFDRLMTIFPDELSVLKNISSVPVGYLSPELVKQSQNRLDRMDISDTDLADSMFVQAHLDKHRGEMHKAFDNICMANTEKLKTIKKDYLEENEEKRMNELKFLRGWTPTPAAQTAQIQTLIILGPSRSGKTTLEAMLQGSPYVASAYETWRRQGRLHEIADMQAKTRSLLQRNATVEGAPNPREAFTLAEIFYKDEDVLIAEGKHILTATNPTFINHVASLADLLPGVCFCNVQRNPAEIAAEIFATNYPRRNKYSYDPEGLLRYLNWYNEMSAAMLAKVRGITLNFEDILAQPGQALGQVEALVGRNLEVQDLVPSGFRGANPFTELFAQRFMK